MKACQSSEDGIALKLQIATKVSEKLRKSGKWHNVEIQWSESLQCYLIYAVEVLLISERYLNLATFIPACYLDQFQCSFFSKLHKMFNPEFSSNSNPRIGQQFLLAIVTAENELVLQSIEFDLKNLA
ncbi:hypothetical protein HWI79_895 [Cryptosporidium felis]|nr:hypothetical protein HWI79_895 [Cryptosporidium felis]